LTMVFPVAIGVTAGVWCPKTAENKCPQIAGMGVQVSRRALSQDSWRACPQTAGVRVQN